MKSLNVPADETEAALSFWRSFRFFSAYRLVIALLFLGSVLAFGDALNLGEHNYLLFRRLVWLYFAIAIALFLFLAKRPHRFHLQLSIQVALDIAMLTLIMYASGGQKSGIAVLILVVVAGSGLVGQGRMTLFYAALASVAILLEQSWRALTIDTDHADFARTGIISIGFFATAIVARLLSQRVIANERLARERGQELNDQLGVSERIVRDMEDGVLVVDRDGRVQLVNPRAQSLLASGDAENPTLATFSPALAERYVSWSRQPAEVAEMFQVKPGRLLRLRYLPPRGQGGKALIYIEDMERVQHHAQQLKLAALGRLTANLAHEIRNPLASISHAAELLSEEDINPVRLRLARIIHDNTGRLNRLVTEVLELGRRDHAQAETLHWQKFIQDFIDEFMLHDPEAINRVSVDDHDCQLRFDRGHLYRVLWNLLGNALRHGSNTPGAVKIDVQPAARLGRIEIRISDDGPGIEEHLRSQVFEPFFTTHGAGTGLGLYIARELCEANGAQLELLDKQPGAHFIVSAEGERCQ